MLRRQQSSLVALFAAFALAACNASRGPEAATPVASVSSNVTPPDFTLPEGSGCSGAIARYRAILDNDLATGHVERSVYEKIQGEIAQASSVCSAGREAQAVALVRASKARHGYPG